MAQLRVQMQATVAFVVVVLMAWWPAFGVADEVIIVNNMGILLELQCTSGPGVDLGYRTIYPGMSWSFQFAPSWWGMTVYACDFHAAGFPLKHMNVYEGANFFDDFCLCRSCYWTVSKAGFDCDHGQYKRGWK